MNGRACEWLRHSIGRRVVAASVLVGNFGPGPRKSRAWPLSPACFILGGVGIWMVAQNPEVRAAAKYQPGYDGLPESGRKLPP